MQNKKKAKTEIDKSESDQEYSFDLLNEEEIISYMKISGVKELENINTDNLDNTSNKTEAQTVKAQYRGVNSKSILLNLDNTSNNNQTEEQKAKAKLAELKKKLEEYQEKNQQKIDTIKNSGYYKALEEKTEERKQNKEQIKENREERDKLLKELPFGRIRASWAKLTHFFEDLPGKAKKTVRKAWRGTVKGIWFALTLPFRIIQKAITIPLAIVSFPITAIVDFAKGQEFGTAFNKIAKAGDRTFEKARSAVVNTLSHQTKESQLKEVNKDIARIENRKEQKEEILGKKITTQEKEVKIAQTKDKIKELQESRKTTKPSKELKKLREDLKGIISQNASKRQATTGLAGQSTTNAQTKTKS